MEFILTTTRCRVKLFQSSHEIFGCDQDRSITDLCMVPTLEGATNHHAPSQSEVNSFGRHQECEGNSDRGLQGASKTQLIFSTNSSSEFVFDDLRSEPQLVIS